MELNGSTKGCGIFTWDGIHFYDLWNFKLYCSFGGDFLWAVSHRVDNQGSDKRGMIKRLMGEGS